MLKERKELEKNLIQVIDKVKYKRKNVADINKILSQQGVVAGTFDQIINNAMLEEIDLSLLCLVTDAVFKVSGDFLIKTEDYFTETEIKESKKQASLSNIADSVELPIILNDVQQINYESYITVMDIVELVKWYNSNIIEYDFETQRSPKYRKGRDGVIPVPELNRSSVDEISEKMLEGTYLEDMMTINVHAEDFEPVTYNHKTRQLTIEKDVKVSILDGFHRLQAAVKSSMIEPDFMQKIIVSIRTYDTETAKRYFGQINTNNPVQKARLEELKQEKVSYITVKQLQINSDLKGRIASGEKINRHAGHWTNVNILVNAIEDVFKPTNNFEAKKVADYLKDFFEYLIGYHGERFNSENKEELINHYRIFIGYIIFAKQFQDKGVPLDQVKNLIDNFDITTNNKKLVEVLESKHSNSRAYRKIKEYFENIDVESILNGR